MRGRDRHVRDSALDEMGDLWGQDHGEGLSPPILRVSRDPERHDGAQIEALQIDPAEIMLDRHVVRVDIVVYGREVSQDLSPAAGSQEEGDVLRDAHGRMMIASSRRGRPLRDG